MDFRHIQHFIQTAELGSLSKAARQLNMVQPALSQSIKRLEAELGTVLFTRSRKGMALTEAGTLFLDHAYGILNQYNRAKENLAATSDVPSGSVSVAMTASALNVLAVPLCDAMSRDYPDINLNLEEGLAANIRKDFEAGRYDLMVSYLGAVETGVKYEPLIAEELFVVAQKGAKQNSINLEELQKIPLIIPQAQHGVGEIVKTSGRRAPLALKASQFSAALHPTLNLVEQGFGQTLLPWSAIYDRIGQGNLNAIPIESPGVYHNVGLIYPAHKPMTQAARQVYQSIKDSVMNVHRKGQWRGKLLMA